MSALAFKTYEANRHAWNGFQAVHGRYDGLTTGVYTHAHLQLLIPLSGRVHLNGAPGGLLLGPERAALIPPGTPHTATTLGGELDFLAINAPASWLAGLASELGGPAIGPGITLLADGGVWLTARALAAALDARRPGFERLLKAGLEQLGVYSVQALAAPEPAAAPDPVARAVDRILRDYAQPLTVEALSASLALSPRQFERRFKALVGLPPRRFLIGVRLAAARDRLVGTDESVEAIASRVGFGNVSHFTRTFGTEVGLSPTAYRRARREALRPD